MILYTAAEFEFTVNSPQIHISDCLDATYYPYTETGTGYSDFGVTNVLGMLLNLYTNFDLINTQSFIKTESMSHKNISLDLLSIFEVNEYMPMEEFIAETRSSIMRSGMSSIFSELSVLGKDDRAQKIREYNYMVQEHLACKKRVGHLLDLTVDASKTVIPIPFEGSLIKLFSYVSNKLDKVTKLKEFKDKCLEASLPKDPTLKNVTLLSKVNRVARLKEH